MPESLKILWCKAPFSLFELKKLISNGIGFSSEKRFISSSCLNDSCVFSWGTISTLLANLRQSVTYHIVFEDFQVFICEIFDGGLLQVFTPVAVVLIPTNNGRETPQKAILLWNLPESTLLVVFCILLCMILNVECFFKPFAYKLMKWECTHKKYILCIDFHSVRIFKKHSRISFQLEYYKLNSCAYISSFDKLLFLFC